MHLTVNGPETRSWRLIGYAGKDQVHNTVIQGDRALDDAMRTLEANSTVTRITVAPA